MRIFLITTLAMTLSMNEGVALQSLIPAPYPQGASGATPLDPEPIEPSSPQRLEHDPYPQILGEDAQGNPPIAHRTRHQHLVPSTNKRKYRVDEAPRP